MKSGSWHQIYGKGCSISLGSSHQLEDRQKFVTNYGLAESSGTNGKQLNSA